MRLRLRFGWGVGWWGNFADRGAAVKIFRKRQVLLNVALKVARKRGEKERGEVVCEEGT